MKPDDGVTRVTETIVGLISRWDGKTAESIVALGFDVERMRRQVSSASSWGVCKAGEAIAGDGSRESTVKLSCERGTLAGRMSIDPASHRLTSLDLVPTRDQRCVP